MTRYINSLSHRSRQILFTLSIFLLTITMGMLVLGTDFDVRDALSTDLLHHSKEQVHHITH